MEVILNQLVNSSDDRNSNKKRNFWTRGLFTVLMMIGFLVILYQGHLAVIALIAGIQLLVYREVISIGIGMFQVALYSYGTSFQTFVVPLLSQFSRYVGPTKMKGDLPWFRSLHYYLLFSTNYFLYGESFISYFKPYVLVDAFLMPLATHHRIISFCLYCIGLIFFVLKLKKGHYRFQFSHFAWTHMALLLVVVQSHFVINNIFDGLIWFVLPSSLVICNDIMAYFFGFFLGRTPLIQLSPKKTWEGFLGGLVSTVIFAFFISGYLSTFSYLTCSFRDVTPGNYCLAAPVFIAKQITLVPAMTGAIEWILTPIRLISTTVPQMPIRALYVAPIQLHALVLALFASLIAPFGGFFASGVKRAFKIKDFSDSIPGHGGLTDRMDCQFIMGVFSSMYFHSFIGNSGATVGSVLENALLTLDIDRLQMLYERLGQYLEGQGKFPNLK